MLDFDKPAGRPRLTNKAPGNTEGFALSSEKRTIFYNFATLPDYRPDLNSVHKRVCRRWISGGNGLRDIGFPGSISRK